MAVLDHITPAELKLRTDVFKNIMNAAIAEGKPLTDEKVRAIFSAILDVDTILDENQDTMQNAVENDMMQITPILNSPTTLTLR